MNKIIEYSQLNSSVDDLHGIGHVKRVLTNAKKISKAEGGDLSLIETMVWLHDIGRIYENEIKKHHALISADMAQKFLKSYNISGELTRFICDGIIAHSFTQKSIPSSLEAKILSDADKIDAIGAVGIFRACAFQHENQSGIQAVLAHFDAKLLKLGEMLYLETSKKIAFERSERIENFKQNLIEELSIL
jgi:uncharacterized protein